MSTRREAGEVATGIREALQALFPVSAKYLLKSEHDGKTYYD